MLFIGSAFERDGRQIAKSGLRYELQSIETRYQWYRQSGSWDYEPVKTTKRIADGQIDVAADVPARISLPVTWGRYRLEVSDGESGGVLTSVNFDAGFYAESSADTPDLLEIALDKKEYAAGDSINVAVTARTPGRVTLDVVSDRLIALVRGFGEDVELAPKKGYVSLRRKKQFALLQPSTKDRFDIGLALKGESPAGRLEAAGSWNAMVSHRIRIADGAEADGDVEIWLRAAYDRAG